MHKSRQALYQDFQAVLQDKAQLTALQQTGDNNTQQQTTITNWLAQLKLLQGIPFHYLVPHENMLPNESIRFFQVDNNWINALIDGAYNIGTTTYTEKAHDEANADLLQQQITQQAQQVRSQKLGIATTATDDTPTITGFLLRSMAVSAYPGMEVEGYATGDTDTQLPILRFEHVSQDILLCLFQGKVTTVKLHNPPEGLHFGLDEKEDGNFAKSLKTMNSTDPSKNGKKIDKSSIDIDQSLYRNDKNVLKINDLAGAIEQKLKDLQQASSTFTSAEFGLQMIEGVDEAILEPE